MIGELYSSEADFERYRNQLVYVAADILMEIAENDPYQQTRTDLEKQAFEAELFNMWRETFYKLKLRSEEKRFLIEPQIEPAWSVQ